MGRFLTASFLAVCIYFKCAFSMLNLIKSCLYLPDLSTYPGGTDTSDGSVCLSNNRLARSVFFFIIALSPGERASFWPNLIHLPDRESFFLFCSEHL